MSTMLDLATTPSYLPDLAPEIHRQRLVIEGYPPSDITPEQIIDYLTQLAAELDMIPLMTPVVDEADQFGWAGWVHWSTSGAHFYAWDEGQPRRFFSIDIYTCKPFDNDHAVDFTSRFFGTDELVSFGF